MKERERQGRRVEILRKWESPLNEKDLCTNKEEKEKVKRRQGNFLCKDKNIICDFLSKNCKS